MRSEILSDNIYSLDINTILFAILVDHINEDIVNITYNDLEKKRLDFWNCGKPCWFTFTEESLLYRIRISNNPFIKVCGNTIIIDLKKIFDGLMDKLSEEELEFLFYNDELAKIFHLFCYLNVDIKVFDPPFHNITSLLRCNFIFNDNGKSKVLK